MINLWKNLLGMSNIAYVAYKNTSVIESSSSGTRLSLFRLDNSIPTSSSLELKALFNQVLQSDDSTSKETTQESDASETKHDKKEADNESDDISK